MPALVGSHGFGEGDYTADVGGPAVGGGSGYGRHMPFEHIYRHHRQYRIVEGSEEIQIRKVAGKLLGFTQRAKS